MTTRPAPYTAPPNENTTEAHPLAARRGGSVAAGNWRDSASKKKKSNATSTLRHPLIPPRFQGPWPLGIPILLILASATPDPKTLFPLQHISLARVLVLFASIWLLYQIILYRAELLALLAKLRPLKCTCIYRDSDTRIPDPPDSIPEYPIAAKKNAFSNPSYLFSRRG